jgi:transcription elongation GreA/GreB family factor
MVSGHIQSIMPVEADISDHRISVLTPAAQRHSAYH